MGEGNTFVICNWRAGCSPPKFNFRPCRGWLWRELVVEDRNERGQAVVAFVISTPEDCIQRLLGGETVRFGCKKFRVKCRWATDTQTSWTFRFFQACVYTYTCTHGLGTPLGTVAFLAFVLLLHEYQLDYQTKTLQGLMQISLRAWWIRFEDSDVWMDVFPLFDSCNFEDKL